MAHGSGTSSKRHEGSLSSRSCGEPLDWEGEETLRLRELEEARARAAQMEKTMRWWSDCTANWREKWSKVRNERNKTREEAKQLRSKLDAALKDVTTYKREKQELETMNEQMRKELERIHLVLLKHAGQWDNQLIEALDEGGAEVPEQDEPERDGTEQDMTDNETDQNGTEQTLDCTEQDSNSLTTPDQVKTWPVSASPPNKDISFEIKLEKDKSSQEKVISLQIKLEQSNKSLLIEREEKAALATNLERLQVELSTLRERCEELRVSRQDSVRELLALQDQHADTVALIRADLMDETNSREGMDRRLADLRAQVERLQGENAGEWGKREKVEAERQGIERENKQLRADLLELQERLDKKLRLSSPTDTSHLHQQISDKTKEVLELKHCERKLKKLVADKTSEAAHMTRRCEQFEGEVRRLRARVEDLKRDLAIAEDEIDSATNNMRKLQRTNDELQEQIDGLHVQMEGLHNRSCLSSSSSNHEERTSDQDVD